MDIIFLKDIKVSTVLGVPEWERLRPQTVILDLEVALPSNQACHTDDIKDTIDYGQIVVRLRQLLSEKSFFLVEALAEQVVQLVMAEFGSPWVRLSVAKPGIVMGVGRLGIIIERGLKT